MMDILLRMIVAAMLACLLGCGAPAKREGKADYTVATDRVAQQILDGLNSDTAFVVKYGRKVKLDDYRKTVHVYEDDVLVRYNTLKPSTDIRYPNDFGVWLDKQGNPKGISGGK